MEPMNFPRFSELPNLARDIIREAALPEGRMIYLAKERLPAYHPLSSRVWSDNAIDVFGLGGILMFFDGSDRGRELLDVHTVRL